MHKQQPAELARQALKLLATRGLPPTPVNFQACYNEIAGLPNVAGFPEAPLRQIALALPAKTEAQQQALTRLDRAIGRRRWQEVQEALVAHSHPAAPPPVAACASGTAAGEPERQALLGEFAQLIENLLPAIGADDPRCQAMIGELVEALRSAAPDLPDIRARLAALIQRLSLIAEEQGEIHESLLKLLRLVVENIGLLSLDDRWLKGQMDSLRTAVEPPLSLRRLDDIERRIRDVMDKQAKARNRAVEVREDMRKMLAEFVVSLASMNTSNTAFQADLEDKSRKLEQVTTIEEMAPLLKAVIRATRAMTEETERTRGQLESLQVKVHATEAELTRLHQDLDYASEMARHDPLTDALNRKGLDEAIDREISRMRRKGMPFSVTMLDIDNFKKINDRLGHDAGDAALVHLANVARECIRPADTLARYGGEEFLILMPDTEQGDGIKVIVRLQRELTRRYFLSGEEKLLITFSAGIAQIGADETASEVIRRADQAMYLAKRAGKNRVVGG